MDAFYMLPQFHRDSHNPNFTVGNLGNSTLPGSIITVLIDLYLNAWRHISSIAKLYMYPLVHSIIDNTLQRNMLRTLNFLVNLHVLPALFVDSLTTTVCHEAPYRVSPAIVVLHVQNIS
jgi:hypothetical protein